VRSKAWTELLPPFASTECSCELLAPFRAEIRPEGQARRLDGIDALRGPVEETATVRTDDPAAAERVAESLQQ